MKKVVLYVIIPYYYLICPFRQLPQRIDSNSVGNTFQCFATAPRAHEHQRINSSRFISHFSFINSGIIGFSDHGALTFLQELLGFPYPDLYWMGYCFMKIVNRCFGDFWSIWSWSETAGAHWPLYIGLYTVWVYGDRGAVCIVTAVNSC